MVMCSSSAVPRLCSVWYVTVNVAKCMRLGRELGCRIPPFACARAGVRRPSLSVRKQASLAHFTQLLARKSTSIMVAGTGRPSTEMGKIVQLTSSNEAMARHLMELETIGVTLVQNAIPTQLLQRLRVAFDKAVDNVRATKPKEEWRHLPSKELLKQRPGLGRWPFLKQFLDWQVLPLVFLAFASIIIFVLCARMIVLIIFWPIIILGSPVLYVFDSSSCLCLP